MNLLWREGGVASIVRGHVDGMGYRISIGVRCHFGEEVNDRIALLDTGAEWSVVGGRLAESLDDGSPLGSVAMSTRLGRIVGTLHRVPVTLWAEVGASQAVPATILLCPEWKGPPVLGFTGCLERFNLALAQDATGATTWFHFGPV